MKANVTHDDAGHVDSFIVIGDRTRWFFNFINGVAEFTRVEVDKDDHATETAVVLFSGELDDAMTYAEELPFVDSVAWQESLEEP